MKPLTECFQVRERERKREGRVSETTDVDKVKLYVTAWRVHAMICVTGEEVRQLLKMLQLE